MQFENDPHANQQTHSLGDLDGLIIDLLHYLLFGG